MPSGRLTDYKPEYCGLANRLAKLGLTEEEMAAAFEVSESTLNLWKKKHPLFSDSIKRGRLFADADVADRLYQRAMGYEHPDVHVSNYQGEITLTPLTKHYPPDTVAAIFWLRNRQRSSGRWVNKDDTSNSDGINTVVVDRNGNTDPAE